MSKPQMNFSKNQRLASLSVLAGAMVVELKSVVSTLKAFADEPAKARLSPQLGVLTSAAAFSGYWSISTYLAALHDLACRIEKEPTEVSGRPEFLSRIQVLSGGIKALGQYLVDVSRGVNANNTVLNEHFPAVVRKCQSSLLELDTETARQIFFMAIPLSLESEALWSAAPQASHQALLEVLEVMAHGEPEYSALIDVNPYSSLSGLFEGLSSQKKFVQESVSAEAADELKRLHTVLSVGVPIDAVRPDVFLLSRLLWSAAHNLDECAENQAFRKRYALLNPAVMRASEGIVSMHGLAKIFVKSLEDISTAYIQSSSMRQTVQVEQMAKILTKEAAKLGLDAFDQLSVTFNTVVAELVQAEADATERRAKETDPEKAASIVPDPLVHEAWIRGAEVLTLLKHSVEMWHSDEAQQNLLEIASRANFNGVIGASLTMQMQSRDSSVSKVMSTLMKEIGTLKASIENALRLAEGQDMDDAKAKSVSEIIGRPSQALFKQASGVMDVLGLQRASSYAHQIEMDIGRAQIWKSNASRSTMFEHIARYSVFVSRLRPGALQDIEPEEMGLERFEDFIESDDVPSMGLFEIGPQGEDANLPVDTDKAPLEFEVDAPVGFVSLDELQDMVVGEAVSGAEWTESPLEVQIDESDVIVQAEHMPESAAAPEPLPLLETHEVVAVANVDDIVDATEVENNASAPVTAQDVGSGQGDVPLSADEPASPGPDPVLQDAEPASGDDLLSRYMAEYLAVAVEPIATPNEIHERLGSDVPVGLAGSNDQASGNQAAEVVVELDAGRQRDTESNLENSGVALDLAPEKWRDVDEMDISAAGNFAGDPGGEVPAADDASVVEAEVMPAAIEVSAEQPQALEGGEGGFTGFAGFSSFAKRSQDDLRDAFRSSGVSVRDDARDMDEELRSVLREESQMCMGRLEQLLSGIEAADPDDQAEMLGSIKREIHTLKGVCRTGGYMRAGNVFHSMEDELDLMGDDLVHFLSTRVAYVEAIQSCSDMLSALAVAVEQVGGDNVDAPEVEAPPASDSPVNESSEPASHEPASMARGDSLQSVLAPSKTPAVAPRARSVGKPAQTVRLPLQVVETVGAATGHVLAAERRLGETMDRARRVARGLEENIKRMSASIREIEIMAAARIAASSVAGSAAGDFDPLELDRYTALQEVVRTLTETHRDVLADISALSAELSESERDEDELHELSDDLQRESSGMLLMPLTSQSARLSSVVDRAAADTGKSVELQISRDCRIPSAALDKLMPVFEHLVRNSIAHGIEIDRGSKPAVGKITIAAKRQLIEEAGQISISVLDDGAGINVDRVLQLAFERGLAKPGRDFTNAEVYDFLFTPGFSTAKEVTALYGRGVGLDVVRDAVTRIGGLIAVESVPGQWTEFQITIPTDAATMAVLPVQQGKAELLFPVSSIREVLPMGAAASSRIRQVEGGYELDGKAIEVIPLSAKVPASSAPEVFPASSGYLVVMREGNGSKGILVQGVKTQFRAAVTPLGPYVRSIPGFVAGTVGQGGRVGLIVNPLRMNDVVEAGSTAGNGESRQSCLMVVDDSPSMRLVTERAVRRLGYSCISATDGLDALSRISAGARVDGFLLDLEMPGLDGFGLIAELRRSKEHATSPIVVISSRTAEKHREKVFSLGANDYLAKPYDDADLERVVAKHFSIEVAL